MGIDGIGKPPVPPAPGAPGSVAPSAPSGEAFRVGAPQSAAPAQGSEALGRLQRGEIALDQYLDIRVNEAVAHLQDKLSAEQLDFVKESLRAQLESDPVLVELVRRATGNNVGI